MFTSCFNKANSKAKFGYWGGKKLLVLPSLWSDDMNIGTIEVFEISHLGGTDQRSYSFWSA